MKRISSLLLVAAVGTSTVALSCPFCGGPPTQTWSELLAEADAVVFAEVISVDRDEKTGRPAALVKVLEIHKGGAHLPPNPELRVPDVDGAPGDRFILHASLRRPRTDSAQATFAGPGEDQATATEPGDRIRPASVSNADAALLNAQPVKLVWDLNQQVTQAAWKYITGAPTTSEPTSKRLSYFVKFLEADDSEIAIDAWSEFANAQYDEVAAVRDVLDRRRLRDWIAGEQTDPLRLGLYGMLLGLCGTADDAVFLRQQIGTPQPDRISSGTDGLMGGLLLLNGLDGLEFIRKTRLENPSASPMDIIPAVGALKFIWTYEPDLLDRETLRRSLHPLLTRPGVRELIIRDLARWEDWSIVTQLPQVYATSKADSDEHTIRALSGFLDVLIEAEGGHSPESVAQARELLEKIRAEYPRLNSPLSRFPR